MNSKNTFKKVKIEDNENEDKVFKFNRFSLCFCGFFKFINSIRNLLRLFIIIFFIFIIFCLEDYFSRILKINIFDFSKKSINFYKNIELKDNDNKNISLKNYGNETKTIINDLNKTILNIPIVFYLDDESVPFVYTTIISILDNKYNSTHYSFYLLVSSNISKNNENNINKIDNKYQCSINFIYIEKIFEDLTMNISNITISNYYRLLIPDLMPRELNKCIYLDADICVLKDLSELYNIDLKDYYVAGVVDAGYYFDEKENCKRLNITSMKNYINEGVLVLNLEQIRKDNMTKKFIEFSSINYNLQSKDILNVACYGKILSLPPKYNAMVLLLKENSKRLRELFNEEEIFEANNAPSIIHYSDQKKPWNNIRVYMDKYWWDVAKKLHSLMTYLHGKIFINMK